MSDKELENAVMFLLRQVDDLMVRMGDLEQNFRDLGNKVREHEIKLGRIKT